MKKTFLLILLALCLVLAAGCAPADNAGGDDNAPDGAALADGTYQAAVTLTGGTGKASVASPAQIKVENGEMTATIVWSSNKYDYMIVDGEKYLPVSTDEHSVFEIPISGFDAELPVTADTTAMSQPHEIDYTLNFDSSTLEQVE